MIAGGGEAGQVGHHPTAHGHDGVTSGEAEPGEPAAQALDFVDRDLAPSPSGTVKISRGRPGSTSMPMSAWVTTATRPALGTADERASASSSRAPSPTATS